MRHSSTIPCEVDACERFSEAKRGGPCRLHRYRIDRYGSPEDPRSERSCRVCGVTFLPARADATTCHSPDCKAEAKLVDMRAAAQRVRDGGPSIRAPRVTKPKWEVPTEWFTQSDVGDRDGWVCQVCGHPVDRRLGSLDPDSASLTQADPFEGPTFSNCQLAHLRCTEDWQA